MSSPRAERSGAERGIKGAGGLRSEVKVERERRHCAKKRPIVREESPDIRQVHNNNIKLKKMVMPEVTLCSKQIYL